MVELALLQANSRFRARFAFMERRLGEEGRDIASTTPEELEALWEEAMKNPDYRMYPNIFNMLERKGKGK